MLPGSEEPDPATLHPPDTSARESRALPWEQDLMRHLAPALQLIREEVPIMHIIRDHLRLLFWVRPGLLVLQYMLTDGFVEVEF